MAGLPELNSFFGGIVKHNPNSYIKDYEQTIFVLMKEFNLSLKEIEYLPIPLIFSLLDIRNKQIKEQNKQYKK